MKTYSEFSFRSSIQSLSILTALKNCFQPFQILLMISQHHHKPINHFHHLPLQKCLLRHQLQISRETPYHLTSLPHSQKIQNPIILDRSTSFPPSRKMKLLIQTMKIFFIVRTSMSTASLVFFLVFSFSSSLSSFLSLSDADLLLRR